MQIGAKCISPILSHTLTVVVQWPKFDAESNREFGLQSFQLMSGKSFRIQEHLKTQSGEENSSSPVGHVVLTLTLDSGTFIEGLSRK